MISDPTGPAAAASVTHHVTTSATPEQIIRKLREGAPQLGERFTIEDVCKHLEISDTNLRRMTCGFWTAAILAVTGTVLTCVIRSQVCARGMARRTWATGKCLVIVGGYSI